MVSINDVLKASKGLHVDDIFAELWGRKLSGGYTIEVYTGTLPATITGTKAGYLHRYKIYGNVGENLFDKNNVTEGIYVTSSGSYSSSSSYAVAYIPVTSESTYTAAYLADRDTQAYIGFCNANKDIVDVVPGQIFGIVPKTFTVPSGIAYVALSVRYSSNADTAMLVEGSTAPESYIPYEECGERTENLFDLNRLPSNTWTTDTRYYMKGGIATSKDVVPSAVSISVNNDTLSVTATSGNGAGFLVEVKPSTEYRLLFTKSESLASNKTSCMYALVDTSETIGQVQAIYGDADGVVFTTESNTKYIYLVFRKAAGTISYSNIMLSEGQTSLPYIPYGYKLPLTSAGQNVDIYIGDDTLSAEEYVDSGTGKIYRMVDGTLTPVDPPIPFPQIPTLDNSTTISWAGEGLAPSEVEFEYERV